MIDRRGFFKRIGMGLGALTLGGVGPGVLTPGGAINKTKLRQAWAEAHRVTPLVAPKIRLGVASSDPDMGRALTQEADYVIDLTGLWWEIESEVNQFLPGIMHTVKFKVPMALTVGNSATFKMDDSSNWGWLHGSRKFTIVEWRTDSREYEYIITATALEIGVAFAVKVRRDYEG